MHGNGRECGPSGSGNFGVNEIGHFGCHTLPLVSRSAMKRPLSLSSERERPSSTVRDHYRCRAFRSRSKTIHSDTVGRSYNYKEFVGQCNSFANFLDTNYDSRTTIKGFDLYHRKSGQNGQISSAGDKNASLLMMPESDMLEEMSVDEDDDDDDNNSRLTILQDDANSDSSLQSTCNELSSINLFHQYNANKVASTQNKPVLDFNLNPNSALCSSTKFKLNFLLSARDESIDDNSCMRVMRPVGDNNYQFEPQLSASFGHSTNALPQAAKPNQLCDPDLLSLPSHLNEGKDANLAINVYSQLNIRQPTQTLDNRSNFSNQANSSLNSASILPKAAPSFAENRSAPLSLTTGSAHIPTEAEKAQFQRSLNSATTLVFHRRSGLPLTSSPAPIRKSGTCFDFDSSLTSVNAIKKALFENSPDGKDPLYVVRSKLSSSAPTTTSGLLGNFEESVLNGRLEPASIVHGFTAEIGASGSFCPKHKTLPVTVFFYTLQDTDKGDKISSPYLGHINLGNKGYHIPRQGTVQVTLFNPNGTVVKMFVVRYNLSDMPPNSRTFLRQRTLFMPSDANEHDSDSRKWLRYLIHLRFQSSKSGRIRLHTDMRILVFRKHDLDVATLNGGVPYELRSFVQMPSNPKYSKNIKS